MATTTTNQDPSSTDTTVVSAPGKLLLVGGYLVLDEGNVGIPIGVDARFYASCSTSLSLTGNQVPVAATKDNSNITTISVVSPQFDYSTWNYVWNSPLQSLTPSESESATESKSRERNPFIEKALRVALLYLDSKDTDLYSTPHITLTIVADNDFYSLVPHLQSQNLPCTLEAANDLPKRLPAAKHPETGAIYKTGLGSSACLVTALTGALVHHFIGARERSTETNNTIGSNNDQNLRLTTIISRLAQIGHCFAQGKVGSGFDVSAACFGSHVYRRFGSAVLAPVLTRLEADEVTSSGKGDATGTDNESMTTADLVRQTVDTDSLWIDAGVVAPLHCFHEKSFLQVIMADVSGGSESPSMAKHVLKWKASQEKNATAIPHWDDLARLNRQTVDLLEQVYSLQPTSDADNGSTVQQELIDGWSASDGGGWANYLANTTTPSDENNVVYQTARVLQDLRTTLQQVRLHLKSMGDAAGGVPIEPDVQSALCNVCVDSIPGVVACLVPGAGGYDAVACLYINTPSTRNAIANLWATWHNNNATDTSTADTSTNVCALTVSGVDYGDGVRLEVEFPTIACDPPPPPADK